MSPLPKSVDPFKLADQSVELEGEIALNQLQRLTQHLAENEGAVHVLLRFGRDEEGIRNISGRLEGEFTLTCQRCLEPVKVRLDADTRLGLVYSEEGAKQLPKRYDPVVVEDHNLPLWELIEEELLLSLPLVPVHEEIGCNPDLNRQSQQDSELQRDNPFAILASLKKDHSAE